MDREAAMAEEAPAAGAAPATEGDVMAELPPVDEVTPVDRETNEAFAAVLQLLARLFRFPADDATVAALRDLAEAGEDDLFMRDAGFARGARAFVASFGGDDPAASKQAAGNDFHKLFVGPLTLLAAPWSTVYLDGGMLFGATERAVREEFHLCGFEIPEGTHEPCDHIAYELQFLAEMHKRAAGMAQGGAEEADATPPGGTEAERALQEHTLREHALQERALQEAKAFRERFLDTWYEPFLAKVEAGSRVGAYRGLAAMTRAALDLEERALAKA